MREKGRKVGELRSCANIESDPLITRAKRAFFSDEWVRARAARFGASFVSTAILFFVVPRTALTADTGGNSAVKNRRPDSGPR